VAARSLIPRLTDIIEAIERIRAVMGDIPLDVFEADWQRQWLVERGVEIISEASRHLTDELPSFDITRKTNIFSSRVPQQTTRQIPFRPNSLMWLTKF
jgi:hypothetical protein